MQSPKDEIAFDLNRIICNNPKRRKVDQEEEGEGKLEVCPVYGKPKYDPIDAIIDVDVDDTDSDVELIE